VQSDEADRVIEHALTQGPYPGIAALVERHGQAVYRRAFGHSDIEAQTPLKPETRLPIGSITKSFTGLAAMQLVAAGKIRLDDVIARHLPGLRSPADAGPFLPLRYQGMSRFVSAIDDEHVFQFRVNPDGSVDLTMLYYEGTIAAHKAP